MSCSFYMDVHVPSAITGGLRHRGVDVLTAQEDGAARLPDSEILDRAGALGRLLFTWDKDFLREGAWRRLNEQPFCGIVFAHQQLVTIGQCIADLELIAKAGHPGEFARSLSE
ncbi:MAG: DUF5615 family PIN-like protein [Armatimonadetes bacterium]|nr:DUF5615 family PIN-like protein [Armatimonadota bacterium]